MKKIILLLLVLLMPFGVFSETVFAAELDSNEMYILERITDAEFPVKIEPQYVNQLKNYFCQEDVSLKIGESRRFVYYLRIALAKREKNIKNSSLSVRDEYSVYSSFQKAMNEIKLFLEYDSVVNDFYAVNQKGDIVIDWQPIIKKTDIDLVPEGIQDNQLMNDLELTPELELSEGMSVETIIISVMFAIILVFFIIAMKNEKIRKKLRIIFGRNSVLQDDIKVQRKMNNFFRKIRYIYVSFIMMAVIMAVSALTINLLDIKEMIRDNLANGCTISYNEIEQEKQKITFQKQEQLKEIKLADVIWPKYGEKYGQIRCEDLDIDAPVFWGDRGSILERGAGNYCGSNIPGAGGSILIGAHDTTYFKGLENVKKGDVFQFATKYGMYQYTVSQIAIYDSESYDKGYDLQSDKEQLILYTCYPFGTLKGIKTERMFVYLEKTDGPDIKNKEIHYEKGQGNS